MRSSGREWDPSLRRASRPRSATPVVWAALEPLDSIRSNWSGRRVTWKEGIFDGRGLAAALMLGAVGVNVGTRFLAAREARSSDQYKLAILAAASEDVVKFDALNDLFPSPGTKGYRTVLRSVRTPFIDELQAQPELACRREGASPRSIEDVDQAGNVREVMPTAGETVGGDP